MKLKEKIITELVYWKNKKKRKTISLAKQLKGGRALEIGGPSKIFGLKSFFPAYLYTKAVDGVNFSNQTVWEGNIVEGTNYHYISTKPPGQQFIDEAGLLQQVADNSYDLLISSHCLEHLANPLGALQNWVRVVRPGGRLCIIVPFKNGTFDHRRPFTGFEHLLNDFNNHTGEDDSTHFAESIALTDLAHPVMNHISKEEFVKRTNDNFQNRCVHHHVFSVELLQKMFAFLNCNVLHNEVYDNLQLLVIAEKL